MTTDQWLYKHTDSCGICFYKPILKLIEQVATLNFLGTAVSTCMTCPVP